MFIERTSVGLDVHARAIVACALDTATGQVTRRRLVPSSGAVLDWFRELAGPVAVAYEAGPTGYSLARGLTAAGVRCVVAAPSKLHRPVGDRIKTDARDALHLARLLRMDEVVEVRVPGGAEEAARDLVRARDDVRADLMRCRHRVSKLLLRHGIVYSGGPAWTGAHETWLRGQQFSHRGVQLAFDADLEAMVLALDRRNRLDKAITEMAADGEYTAVVHRLGCLRGVSTLTAFGLAVEVGDWHRFTGATIGAYLGLVPTESSSGQQRSQGSITKAGNTHARRLLVEAAWHHRRAYRTPGATMRARWNLASPAAKARGHTGNHRLHQRWQTFITRKKRTVIANVAVARELAGWCWSLAVLDD
ncbi:MAG TPA: IS110 family transposase [Rugosimonospora sp.]|nr:IS110 family transposase [Rugosimonospora sp.]